MSGRRHPQAATTPLRVLNAKLVKVRHELATATLKLESLRADSERCRLAIEDNDVAIAAMEEKEQQLKLAFVEGKLAFEKVGAGATPCAAALARASPGDRAAPCVLRDQAHAEKFSQQQELKKLRMQRQVCPSPTFARRCWFALRASPVMTRAASLANLRLPRRRTRRRR